MSGLGKGVLTASVTRILRERGHNAVPLKFDGYLNVDCGTMNPFRHGEVFVLEDGGEVDMDFGTYERFLGLNLPSEASITGGKLFKRIIEKERKGEYLGQDVQVVPHLTDEIQEMIRGYGKKMGADIVVIEVGGTVGDIENNYFIEAVRQLLAEETGVVIQLTWVPSLAPGEQKTKPTQHANKLIRSLGLNPEIIVARQDEPLTEEAREKIALFCDVDDDCIFNDPKLEVVYELPLVLERQGFYAKLRRLLSLSPIKTAEWSEWEKRLERWKKAKKVVKIGVVGKYASVRDAYASIYEALMHAGGELGVRARAVLIDAERVEQEGTSLLEGLDGIIVPGGFGQRGIEGKIAAVRFARERKVPFLGICLGMQMMVVEFARNVLGWKDAASAEFCPESEHRVIDILPEQRRIVEKGGTMRLGAFEMIIRKGTRLWEAYRKERVAERHRHRYEVNPDFVKDLERGGLVIAATSTKGEVVEGVEWRESFGIGLQAHPELSSKFERPSPVFVALVKAAAEGKNGA